MHALCIYTNLHAISTLFFWVRGWEPIVYDLTSTWHKPGTQKAFKCWKDVSPGMMVFNQGDLGPPGDTGPGPETSGLPTVGGVPLVPGA